MRKMREESHWKKIEVRMYVSIYVHIFMNAYMYTLYSYNSVITL